MSRTILLQVDPTESAASARARIATARQAGFPGIEWVLNWRGRSDDENAAAIVAEPGPTPFELPTPAASIRYHAPELPGAIETVRAAIATAKRIGAGVLSLDDTRSDGPVGGSDTHSYQDRLNTAYAVLRALRSEAAAAGVVLAIIAPQVGFLSSPVEVRELIDGVNAWNVGVCIDADRVARIGCLADWLRTLGARVQAVRAGTDGSAALGARGVRLKPTEVLTVVSELVAENRPIVVSARVAEPDWSAWLGDS